MYALMKTTRQGANDRLRHVLYGVCGNRRLLEKIRIGQDHPEEWRIVGVGSNDLYQYVTTQRRAG